jgi:hypothetical protein
MFVSAIKDASVTGNILTELALAAGDARTDF